MSNSIGVSIHEEMAKSKPEEHQNLGFVFQAEIKKGVKKSENTIRTNSP
jgi:hypothetical protein